MLQRNAFQRFIRIPAKTFHFMFKQKPGIDSNSHILRKYENLRIFATIEKPHQTYSSKNHGLPQLPLCICAVQNPYTET